MVSTPKETSSSPPARYWAFISYSHRDEKWAAWLHERLERYRIPRAFVGRATAVGPVPGRLYPVFRDRNELPSSSDLPDSIRTALSESRNLVVICSPHAVASRWVDEETRTFKRLGLADRVFCLVVDGEPFASDRVDAGVPEALPAAVRYELGPDGAITNSRVQPLAADVRTGKDGKRAGSLKLIAGLLDLRLGDLVARDRRRRTRRIIEWVIGGLAMATVVVGIWLRSQKTVSQEQQRANREAAIASARSLAEQAQTMLDGDPARLPTALLLGVEALQQAVSLGVPADAAYDVVRNGLALLPLASPGRFADRVITSGTYSHDGRRLATIDGDTLRLIDATTGGLDASAALRGRGLSSAFSATDHELLTISDRQVERWDVPPLARIAVGPHADVDRATASADGTLVATAAARTLSIRETASGQVVQRLDAAEPVTSLAISPDGRFLMAGIAEQHMTGPGNPGVQLWEVRTGREIAHHRQPTFVEAIAFSADSRLVAAGSGTGIRIFETATGREVRTLVQSTAGDVLQRVNSLAFAASSPWLAAGGGSIVQVWDASDGREVARIAGVDGVLAFSPADRGLLTTDGTLWNMSTTAQRTSLMTGDGVVVQIALGGGLLAAGRQSGGADLWDQATGRPVARLPEDAFTTVQAMSPDGRYAVTMSGVTLGSTWGARLWAIADARRVAELSPGGQIEAIVISPDSRLVATSDHERRITVFATATGESLFATRFDDDVREMAFVGDGHYMVVLGRDGAMWSWRPGSNPSMLDTAGQRATAMTATSGGQRFAIALEDSALLFLDPASGAISSRSPFMPAAGAMRISADQRRAVAAKGARVEVRDIATGRRLAEIALDPTTGPDADREDARMAISGDGEWLAIVSPVSPDAHYAVSIWHAPTGRRVATWTNGASEVVPGSDGRLIATLADGRLTVDFWQPQDLVDAACARISPEVIAEARRARLLPEASPCRRLAPPAS